MTNRKHHLKVFLCHASDDKPKVRDIYLRLINYCVDAWLDEEKLLPGQTWRDEIPHAVHDSDVVIIFLSKQSITKEGFIQKEIKHALDAANEKPAGTIFIIPARLEECEVPNELRNLQWVDLFNDNGFPKLIKALDAQANKIGTSTVKIKDRTRPKESKTSPPIQLEAKPIQPKVELEKPTVSFAIKLTFTVAFLIILVYISYAYFFVPNNRTLFTCTPPTFSAIGLSIVLWFLASLGWCYLEEPIKNIIAEISTGQQDYKIMLTKILFLLADLLLLGQLSKKILLFFTIVTFLGTLTIWGLNWNGIPIFFIAEETPRILAFSVNDATEIQTYKPGDTFEIKRGQQFLVMADHLPENATCSWSSAEKGALILEADCSTQYGPLLVAGKLDTLTVQVQSACKTKSVTTGLNVKILEP